ncbi:MAG: hypothetical protein AAF564_15870 [Bacteroidota bacterium]
MLNNYRLITFILLCLLLAVGVALEWEVIWSSKLLSERNDVKSTLDFTNDALTLPTRSTNDNYHINTFQGVVSEIDGLRYYNHKWWFDSEDGTADLAKYGGFFNSTPTQLHLEIDDEGSGLPDIIANISQPQVLTSEHIASLALGNQRERIPISNHLRRRLEVERPVEKYEWQYEDESGTIQRQFMELWLMTFDVTIETQPARTNLKQKRKYHEILGRRLSNKAEYEDQRHAPFDLLIKLSPNDKARYYQGIQTEFGNDINSDDAEFGIAAVEILDVDFYGDKEETEQRIGAFAPKGLAYALYESRESIPFAERIESEDGQNELLTSPIANITGDFYELINQRNGGDEFGLFNETKYFLIRVSNIGSWRKGNWLTDVFSKGTKYADRIHIRFAVYLFVKGNWWIKKPTLTSGLQPNDVYRQDTEGLIPRIWSGVKSLLPSFKMGFFGRLISIFFIFSLAAISFPGVSSVLSRILKKITKQNNNSRQ